ncbi:MAG: antitoxin family protein [Pyrinomonadaceae bacterium]
MTKTLEAVFDGAVFRPDEKIDLEPNTRVEIVIRVKPTAENVPKSFLRTARSLRLQGPKDFSSRIDDYLYGGAKMDGE